MLIALLICALLVGSSTGNVVVTPGVLLNPPEGYQAYNIDPTLNSTDIGPIYDANFIPGFEVGLTNISITWDSGPGYGRIGYSVGPWQDLHVGMPHLAVGPQCCNFKEVPRTQQFRRVEWGDYYTVKGGFHPPAVNEANFTSDFTAPAYVGLRTDWQWTVSVSLDWGPPKLLSSTNEWAAIGISITEYVPNAPHKLIYTVLNFWMDGNSSRVLAKSATGSDGFLIVSPQVVVYSLLQLNANGNQTIMLNISPYLENTLRVLNLTTPSQQPPVISYVYLNVEGYNFVWRSTLYSFFVMSKGGAQQTGESPPFQMYYLGIVLAGLAIIAVFKLKSYKKSDGVDSKTSLM
ncbi:MAG: hypothetical protein ABSF82_06130 [Candidatus Bathyarchaeia archaeon]|jgi:hypothetical protein